MELFSQKGIKKVREICAKANLIATWQEDEYEHNLTIEQRERLISEGIPELEKMQNAYRSLDKTVPGGHHQYLEKIKFDFLRDEVHPILKNDDFNKECFVYWNLLDEKGFANQAEVVSEMTYEIEAFVSDSSILNIDLNLDVMLRRENTMVYAVPESNSWDTFQLERAKRDVEMWCYMRHENNPKVKIQNTALLGVSSYREYKMHPILAIPIANTLKEFLVNYPEGIAIENNCLKALLENQNDPEYINVSQFKPFTKIQMKEDVYFLDVQLYGIERFELVNTNDADKIHEDLIGGFLDGLEKVIKTKAAEQTVGYLNSGMIVGTDTENRTVLHWAYMSEDKALFREVFEKLKTQKEALLHKEDDYGVTIHTLHLRSNSIVPAHPLTSVVEELWYRNILDKLPSRGETAQSYETTCNLMALKGSSKLFIIEQDKVLKIDILSSTVIALELDEFENSRFVIVPIYEIDSFVPLNGQTGLEAEVIYIDGSINYIPF